MSSDPNKRKHFRYPTVFSVSSRLLFQNLVRILKLYWIASGTVTIVVRDTRKYVNCEYDSIPLQCNPDIFLNVYVCVSVGVSCTAWAGFNIALNVELNM